MRKISLLLAIIILASLPPITRAQQKYPFDLAISPSVVEIAVKPGALVTQAFLVENAGSYDLEVTPVLCDFKADDKSGHPILLDQNTFPYAQLENAQQKLNESFLLTADSSQQLVLGLNIPSEAVEKDWYFSLLLQTKPVGIVSEGSAAEARGSVAANVLVRVTSTNKPSLRWKMWFESLPRIIDSLQSINIRPFVKNEGETVAAPEISVVVLDWKQAIVYEKTGLPDRILAGATREIYGSQPRKDDPRSAEAVAFQFDPLFAFGPYSIRTSIRNAADGPLVLEEQVWAFPFSLMIAGISVLAIGLSLRKARRRKSHHSLT